MAGAIGAAGLVFLPHDADEAGLGLFEAVKNAPDGVYAIGVIQDQNGEAPGKVLTSATMFIGGSMKLTVQRYLEGGLAAECYKFGVKEGVVGLSDYHECANVLTDDQKAYVKGVVDKIASGEIQVKSAQQ